MLVRSKIATSLTSSIRKIAEGSEKNLFIPSRSNFSSSPILKSVMVENDKNDIKPQLLFKTKNSSSNSCKNSKVDKNSAIYKKQEELGRKISHYFRTGEHSELIKAIDQSEFKDDPVYVDMKKIALQSKEHEDKIKERLELKRNKFNVETLKPLLEKKKEEKPFLTVVNDTAC